LTANGKVNRAALRSTTGSRGERPGAGAGAGGGTLDAVAAIVRGILGTSSVGLCDDLFDKGGTSLSMMRILAGIADTFGVEVSGADLVEAATIAALAACVDQQLNEKQVVQS